MLKGLHNNGKQRQFVDTKEVLKHFPFLSFLNDIEPGQVGGLSIKSFRKNQTVLSYDDTEDFMYIILEGKLKVLCARRDSERDLLIAIHDAGEFFGVVSAIDGKVTPSEIIAMKDSTILFIRKEHFFSMIDTNKEFRDGLIKMLCQWLRCAWDKLEIISFDKVLIRLKYFLLMVSEKGRNTTDGIEIDLNRNTLAQVLGVRYEAVINNLKILKHQGIIIRDNKETICISHDFVKNPDPYIDVIPL
ncbi:MAG: Crp/Fnr family transcriptional regulator [Nitrospirae bacterium]|uniref:Crp/Fnr family transcriptional regulator n=1 Tax=Candidatus Magnetobacterium casense TaxID=1455061 RepID=UPI00058E4B91|nr:Crp/Fnr family transcriptional regulator [Candidatus Magnetobacterium casensis]MBF0337605.1 Crp/Fnr family transcriptional regulator [Nitrospirota bacterium]